MGGGDEERGGVDRDREFCPISLCSPRMRGTDAGVQVGPSFESSRRFQHLRDASSWESPVIRSVVRGAFPRRSTRKVPGPSRGTPLASIKTRCRDSAHTYLPGLPRISLRPTLQIAYGEDIGDWRYGIMTAPWRASRTRILVAAPSGGGVSSKDI